MSWSLQFAARSQASAIAKVCTSQHQSPKHFPAQAADAINKALALCPENLEGRVLVVEANGHTYDGHMRFELKAYTMQAAEPVGDA